MCSPSLPPHSPSTEPVAVNSSLYPSRFFSEPSGRILKLRMFGLKVSPSLTVNSSL